MFFCNKYDTAIPLFLSTNFLPVSLLYFKSVAILMYDISKKSCPETFTRLVTHVSHTHHFQTRFSSKNTFQIKYSRLEIQRSSFSRTGTRIWNIISNDTKLLPKNKFKQEIHISLLTLLQNEQTYLDIDQLIHLFTK